MVESSAPLIKGIKILLNIKKIDLQFLKKFPFVTAVGLYGSCAKGENNRDSDVDLWLLTDHADEEKKAALAAAIRKQVDHAKLLFLDPEKIKALKKQDELFYHALSFGSILLAGDSNALEL